MDINIKPVLGKKLFPSRFYDAFFITEYGKLESLRASRYNTFFSIVLINIEPAKGRLNEAQKLEFFEKLVSTVLESVRNCDVVGMSDNNQILIVLPETDYFGSLAAIRKLSKTTGLLIESWKGLFSLIFSNSTFPKDGKGFGEILNAAARRTSLKKESLWEKHSLKKKLFWEIIGEVSGGTYAGFDDSSFDAGAGQELSEFFIDQICELLTKEISRTPQRRGILYFASKKISAGMPLIKLLSSAGGTATKIFLVGESDDSNVWETKNATPVLLDDPRLRETFFTFFLNEDSGYALVCKENWGATFSCFHTSDACLVEGLITKFQNEYSLQEQLG